jgi:hypothetical protein
MNAKPGALDSADGQAPAPRMKGICFPCAAFARRLSESKTPNSQEGDFLNAKNDETVV